MLSSDSSDSNLSDSNSPNSNTLTNTLTNTFTNTPTNKVIGVMKFNGGYTKLYKYKCQNGNIIFVSDHHLVYENDKWIRVKNSVNKLNCVISNRLNCLIPNQSFEINDIIYCLLTNTGYFISNNTKFSDYQEINHLFTIQELSTIRNNILSGLNNEQSNYTHPICHKIHGVSMNTILTGSYSSISNISIDSIFYEPHQNNLETIEGVVKFDASAIDQYDFYGIKASGDMIVYFNEKWIPLREHPEATLTDKPEKYMYNILTSSGLFSVKINDTKYETFVDFNQIIVKQTNVKTNVKQTKHTKQMNQTNQTNVNEHKNHMKRYNINDTSRCQYKNDMFIENLLNINYNKRHC